MIIFYTLGQLQKKLNKSFYNTKNLYDVFTTFAGSKKFQEARAKKCLDLINNRELYLAEVGPGDGIHTELYLRYILENGDFERIVLDAYDFSKRNLKRFKKRVKNLGIEINLFLTDLSIARPFLERKYYVITFHEMLDDLPASACVLEDSTYELLFDQELNVQSKKQCKRTIPKELCGYYIVFNDLAWYHVFESRKFLRENGYVELSDYGFTYESIDVPKELWNLNAVREIEGHITVDLNFSQFKELSQRLNADAELWHQKEFAEEMLGKKLWFYSEDKLDYYTTEEINRDKKLRKLFSQGIIEHDNYWYAIIYRNDEH